MPSRFSTILRARNELIALAHPGIVPTTSIKRAADHIRCAMVAVDSISLASSQIFGHPLNITWRSTSPPHSGEILLAEHCSIHNAQSPEAKRSKYLVGIQRGSALISNRISEARYRSPKTLPELRRIPPTEVLSVTLRDTITVVLRKPRKDNYKKVCHNFQSARLVGFHTRTGTLYW